MIEGANWSNQVDSQNNTKVLKNCIENFLNNQKFVYQKNLFV